MVAASKSSKTNLHTKNSQAATMPQLAAATKPHHCCLFAAIHCEKPLISIRVQHPVGLATCVKRLVADRFYLIANMSPCLRRPFADQSQTCQQIIIFYPNMGIKLLDKCHRSPVSCKEISRGQVVNRSRSQC